MVGTSKPPSNYLGSLIIKFGWRSTLHQAKLMSLRCTIFITKTARCFTTPWHRRKDIQNNKNWLGSWKTFSRSIFPKGFYPIYLVVCYLSIKPNRLNQIVLRLNQQTRPVGRSLQITLALFIFGNALTLCLILYCLAFSKLCVTRPFGLCVGWAFYL